MDHRFRHIGAALLFGGLAVSGCHNGNKGEGDEEGAAVESSEEASSEPATSPSVPYDWYVDGATGSDSLPGTQSAPVKTIARALTLAQSGQSVKVAPGTYSATTGEVFPIVVPAGVSLIGDEPNKGGGTTPTVVSGGAYASNNGKHTTLDLGAAAVVAGFTLTNPTTTVTFPMVLAVRTDGVTIRNNRIRDSKKGIFVYNSSKNHLIAGNRIENMKNGWSGLGIGFIGGGVGSKVENNVIVDNEIGVEYDSAGGDLGGGTAGSAGGNVIAGNLRADLWTITSAIVIEAQNNFWDHTPPQVGTSDTVTAGNDIYNKNGATILTSGAQSAPSNP